MFAILYQCPFLNFNTNTISIGYKISKSCKMIVTVRILAAHSGLTPFISKKHLYGRSSSIHLMIELVWRHVYYRSGWLWEMTKVAQRWLAWLYITFGFGSIILLCLQIVCSNIIMISFLPFRCIACHDSEKNLSISMPQLFLWESQSGGSNIGKLFESSSKISQKQLAVIFFPALRVYFKK